MYRAAVMAAVVAAVLAVASCDLYTYGQLGGADKTDTFKPGSAEFNTIMDEMRV